LSAAPPAKSKKKPSFLGTLFTKEPSTDAFLQMQIQSQKQLAQNPGRKNPPGMSGVSSVKMPEHVPKVNSKWDGMPRKSKDESERSGSRSGPRSNSRPTSTISSSSRSRSADPASRRSHCRRLSDSTTSSDMPNQKKWERSAPQDRKRVTLGDADSLAGSVSSSNSIQRPPAKSVSIRTQSLKSPSGTSLPQITSFFPDDIPEPPGVPQTNGAHGISSTPDEKSTNEHALRNVPKLQEPVLDYVPDQTASPGLTPLEHSPVTPLSEPVPLQYLGDSAATDDGSVSFTDLAAEANEVVLRSSGSDVLGAPIATRKISKESARAFLAGEARPFRLPDEEQRSLKPKSILKKDTRTQMFGPAIRIVQDLEQRPHSSRERLGLRASIIKTDDSIPWDRVEQDVVKRPDSSRARLGLRASMIKSDDTFPWEWDKEKERRPRSDTLNRASVSKNLLPKSFGIFGKV
jgi:hypothetical protein